MVRIANLDVDLTGRGLHIAKLIQQELKLDTYPEVVYHHNDHWIETNADITKQKFKSIIAHHYDDPLIIWPEWKRRLYELLCKETLTSEEDAELKNLMRNQMRVVLAAQLEEE